MFKYILILLIFKKSLLVAYDTPPEFTLEFFPNVKCETQPSKPIIFKNEPFNVILKDDTAHEISNITCTYAENPEHTYAVAEIIQKRKDNMFNITFGKVSNNKVNNNWKCKMRFNTWQVKSWLLEVYIRKNGSLLINDKNITLPVIRYPESKWDASGVYNYTEGEILNIAVKDVYYTHIYIMKDETKVFETRELGEVQLLLNTKYYNGNMSMYMDLCTYSKDLSEKLELKMIPIDKPTDNNLRLYFDGLPLTPKNIDKAKEITIFSYNYIFTFPRLLTIECKIVNPDNSNNVWFYNASDNGKVEYGDSITEIIELEENMSTKKQQCNVYNHDGIVIEEHIITFKYQSPIKNYISGLSVNRTYYQLKREALYEFYDGENLTLEYSQPNNYNPKTILSDIEWVLQDKKFSGRIFNFSLTEKHNGTYINCTYSCGVNSSISHIVHLLLKDKDEINIDEPAVAVSTYFLKGSPFQTYIIAASAIVVAVVLFATLCFVRSSYRKRKLKEATDVSYDNLSNGTQPPFPPNWDNIARSQVKVDELYSVPYTRQTEDITYEEPSCTRVGADIYTEPKRKLKRAGDIYANVSAVKDTTPSVMNVQETYAEVIPKALRKVEDPYAEIGTNPDSYENVFKGEPYANYNNSDYVEAAYCDLSDLK
ncbi:hypothetical protein K1T71_000933 [Dendrolimus kikuchii]|uniref:Uncharacterized protein n=1 Tax=Dendrolimus kikuchii TaxID=765133 RepID=A0ACC1DGE9_9NEOP|nr:hypothetical protein K1T71_000933 [Dendrolimus kikuchii]